MNTKFLFIVILGINALFIIFASQICEVKANVNPITEILDVSTYSFFQTATFNKNTCVAGGQTVNITEGVFNLKQGENSFGNAVNQTATAQTGTFVGGTSIAGFFIDVGRMILAFVALLAGLPIPAFLASLGLPAISIFILSAVLLPFYYIGLIEFFGGRSF